MEISQKLLCFLFLASFVTGIGLGFIFDLCKLSRLLVGLSPEKASRDQNEMPRRGQSMARSTLLFLEDFLFALFGGICLLLLTYFISDGVFRFWSLLGLSGGFFVYRVTIGHLFMTASYVIVYWIHRILRYCVHLLWVPVKLIGSLFYQRMVLPIIKQARKRKDQKQLIITEKIISEFHRNATELFDMNDPQKFK